MSSGRVRMIGCLALLLSPTAPGADYWAYQYKHIDVTVAGSSGYAQHVARNADRLGVALAQVLNFRSDARLPTHIFVLPDDEIVKLLGASGTATYSTTGYDTTVIASAGRSEDDHYWGVYFGYVGSLLAGDGALRYPYWLRLGVPELFATTEFDHERIRTGGIAPGYAYTVADGKLIPLRSFLALEEHDPQLQSAGIVDMYAAQSWFLTREVLVEGRHRDEFSRYLALLSEGRGERAAFTASFSASYEDLDRMLRDDRRAPAHVYVLPSPTDPRPDAAPPRKLAAPEVAARLAVANLAAGHRAEALHLAGQALDADPANETALCAAIEAQLLNWNYPAVLAAVNALVAHGRPSPPALAERAAALTILASAVSAGHADLGVDAPTLLRHAREDYQGALAADPEDLRSWAGLAGLYGAERDTAAAHALLPTAAQALTRHPRNANLAYALAHMCAQTQQWDCAAKFAAAWRDNALTAASRADAAAFEARLSAYRARLASAAPAVSGPPGPAQPAPVPPASH
jgi:tetratricopeptide (TPR) repeat protein